MATNTETFSHGDLVRLDGRRYAVVSWRGALTGRAAATAGQVRISFKDLTAETVDASRLVFVRTGS